MVNVKHINALLKKAFWISGQATINPETGVVDVDGPQVNYIGKAYTQLPVQFGRVTGDFDLSYSKLTSLKGCPSCVGGNFYFAHSPITSLEFAPAYVGKDFNCIDVNISSLSGAPETVEGIFSVEYKHNLPLLRLLNYPKPRIWHVPSMVYEIMNAHMHTGKAGVLKCAAELIKAGYKDNARW